MALQRCAKEIQIPSLNTTAILMRLHTASVECSRSQSAAAQIQSMDHFQLNTNENAEVVRATQDFRGETGAYVLLKLIEVGQQYNECRAIHGALVKVVQ
jgi:hypothetical protein